MNSLLDIRIFLGLVPKESPCTMYLKEMGGNSVDWINLAHNRRKWRIVINMETKPCAELPD
jgi:hypothetical protein